MTPIGNHLAIWVPLSHIISVPPIWWFLHSSWVLEKAGHDMAVRLPLTGGRMAYNPSPLVSHQVAPQNLVGAPETIFVLGHWGVCSCPWQLLWDPLFHIDKICPNRWSMDLRNHRVAPEDTYWYDKIDRIWLTHEFGFTQIAGSYVLLQARWHRWLTTLSTKITIIL